MHIPISRHICWKFRYSVAKCFSKLRWLSSFTDNIVVHHSEYIQYIDTECPINFYLNLTMTMMGEMQNFIYISCIKAADSTFFYNPTSSEKSIENL